MTLNKIKQDLRTYVKSVMGTTMVTALISGVIVHLFGLVNVLHNYDDIAVQPRGYGTGITSGRWVLQILGDLVDMCGGNYNLPTVNGIVFIAFLAVAAGFLVSAMEVRNKFSAAALGILFVVFPTVTATMYFHYTLVYYGMAVLCAVLAAWIADKHKYGILLSAVCVAVSLGIYQAYVPMTIAIFVAQLIRQTLDRDFDVRKVIFRGLKDCAALVLGLALYFVCLKISLALYGTQLSDYQGVGTMGQLSLAELPRLIWSSFFSFCTFPVRNYCALADTKLLKLTFLALGAVTVFLIGYLLLQKENRLARAILAALLCLVFPIAVNFIVIMCPGSWIYTLMVYSFVLVPCVPVTLLECLPEGSGKKFVPKTICKVVALLLAIVIFSYANGANISYMSMHFSNRQVENYVNSLVIQARMTDGFTAEKKWAFVGEVDDPLFYSYWSDVPYYDSTNPGNVLINKYSRQWWIQYYVGYLVPMADSSELEQVTQTETFREMPCWPDEGSIKVIDDLLVIKFQE